MGYLLRYQSEFTELAKSRFLDCDSCGMTQGALIRYVADRQALYMQAKQPRSDRLYMTTLDTGRCSHIYIYIICMYIVHKCVTQIIQIHTQIQIHMHAHINIHIHVYIHICVKMNKYIYIHIRYTAHRSSEKADDGITGRSFPKR